MGYCPIDGDDYQDHLTRCPEHDVALVEDPPSIGAPLRWVDRINHHFGARLALIIFIISAVIYALSGFATAALSLIELKQEVPNFEVTEVTYQIQSAAFPVAIAALGALAGALLLRAYLLLSPEEGVATSDNGHEKTSARASLPSSVMRFLFALTVVFALLWAGTEALTSREEAETRFQQPGGGYGMQLEGPSETFLMLVTLNYVSYAGGIACLSIMGASLMAGAARGRREPEIEKPT